MEDITLMTKVLQPQRREDVLTRQRLLDRLYDMIDYKAVLVSAPAGYGKTIAANPAYTVDWDDFTRQSFEFEQELTARYVEFTVVDNFFEEGGFGGDRVGLGEIAFQAPDGQDDEQD